MIGLAVDVEEDGVGRCGDDFLQVREEQRVVELLFEEVDRAPALAVVFVLLVLEQVGQHLDEVRLAAAEEAGDPDSVLVGRLGFRLDRREQDRDEVVDVAGQLARDDELVELLPDRGLIELVGLDDAVDGAMDVAFEEVLDLHVCAFWGTKIKAR